MISAPRFAGQPKGHDRMTLSPHSGKLALWPRVAAEPALLKMAAEDYPALHARLIADDTLFGLSISFAVIGNTTLVASNRIAAWHWRPGGRWPSPRVAGSEDLVAMFINGPSEALSGAARRALRPTPAADQEIRWITVLYTGTSFIIFDPESRLVSADGPWAAAAEAEAGRDADWHILTLENKNVPHAGSSLVTMLCAPPTGSHHAQIAQYAAQRAQIEAFLAYRTAICRRLLVLREDWSICLPAAQDG